MYSDYAPEIRKRIDDEVVDIRKNAYNVMINLTVVPEGCHLLIGMDMLKILVDKLVEEKDEDILCQIHELIKRLLYETDGTEMALKTPAIARICDFLSSDNVQLRNYAITNLYCISFNESGKPQELSEGCVLKLAELLRDSVWRCGLPRSWHSTRSPNSTTENTNSSITVTWTWCWK